MSCPDSFKEAMPTRWGWGGGHGESLCCFQGDTSDGCTLRSSDLRYVFGNTRLTHSFLLNCLEMRGNG